MQRDVKQILDKLKELGFGEYWEDFVTLLSKTLKEGDNSRIITKTGTGDVWNSFVLNIEKHAGELSFPFYTGTFVKVPEIEHKVINGIDSEVLEALMHSLDWKKDIVSLEQRLEETGKGNKELISSYHKALANMVMLAATDEGMVISDAFKIRYLTDTPYEQKYVSPELKEKYVNDRTFFVDTAFAFKKDEALNLLEGRSVLKNFLDEEEHKQKSWFKTLPNAGQVEENGVLFSGRQAVFPNYDLASVIKTLPLAFLTKEERAGFIKQLQKGDLCEVAVAKNGKDEIYFIEANPETKSINIYDVNMKPVTRKEMSLGYIATLKKSKGKHL